MNRLITALLLVAGTTFAADVIINPTTDPATIEASDLSDVDTSGASVGDLMEYDGTNWVAVANLGQAVTNRFMLGSDGAAIAQSTWTKLVYDDSSSSLSRQEDDSYNTTTGEWTPAKGWCRLSLWWGTGNAGTSGHRKLGRLYTNGSSGPDTRFWDIEGGTHNALHGDLMFYNPAATNVYAIWVYSDSAAAGGRVGTARDTISGFCWPDE